LIPFFEAVEVALNDLDIVIIEREPDFLSSRFGTMLEKGLNVSRPSLIAKFTAAVSHPTFFLMVALLIPCASKRATSLRHLSRQDRLPTAHLEA
jgi:hypothetical protein